MERLFRIADPDEDRLALIAELDASDSYQARLLDEMARPPWRGKAVTTGFLEEKEVARLLAAADAVVYPFIHGISDRNTSYLAALLQDSFVLATSHEREGYDPSANLYFADPDDLDAMARALRQYKGRHLANPQRSHPDWEQIASSHMELYAELLGHPAAVRPSASRHA